MMNECSTGTRTSLVTIDKGAKKSGQLAAMEKNQVDDITKYKNIERWCLEHVVSGSDFLFDKNAFFRNLAVAGLRFGLEFEVREA